MCPQNVLGVCDHCRAHGPDSCHSEIQELPWLPGYRSRGGGELQGEVGREEAAPELYQVDFRRCQKPFVSISTEAFPNFTAW